LLGPVAVRRRAAYYSPSKHWVGRQTTTDSYSESITCHFVGRDLKSGREELAQGNKSAKAIRHLALIRNLSKPARNERQ